MAAAAAKSNNVDAVTTGTTAPPSGAESLAKRRRKSPSVDDSIGASTSTSPTTLDERILHEIIKFFEMNLDRAPLQDAIAQFYAARLLDK